MATIQSIEKKIAAVKQKIMALGDMHPGSLSKQFNICGTPGCRCKDPDNPKKHGPYYNLSFTHKGRSTSRFINKEYVLTIRRQLSNYKKFKLLVKEWKELATDLSKMRIDEAKKNK